MPHAKLMDMFPRLFLAIVLCCVASGCGSQAIVVEGNVTLDGQGVDTGSISFEPSDRNGPEFGGAIANGAYKIVSPPGTAPGTRTVRIRASRKTGRKLPAGPPFPPSMMIDEIEPVPKRYNDDSKLTAELKAGGSNHIDFPLDSDRGQPK